jgi:hypothetical protein
VEIMRASSTSWGVLASAVTLSVAEVATVVFAMVTLPLPAEAQFFLFEPPSRSRRYERQDPTYNPFSPFLSPEPRYRQVPRQAPVDQTKAPNPTRQYTNATTNIVVIGDSLADWLAYGLEEAFAEKPEIGITRKHRIGSGLIRYEARRDVEWAQIARDIIRTDKPGYIVVMIGLHDRQSIRERTPVAVRPATPATPAPAQPQNPPPQQAPDSEAQPSIVAPELPRVSDLGPFEFRSDKWEAAYVKRIDEMLAVLKSAKVPVFWVGLPSIRGTKSSSDVAYLNDLYRQRAEKAGVTFVDVWDGFVDEAGRFVIQGPDYEGQTRRLRSGDGVHFTNFGARKLAHYVEREIQRSIVNRAVPVALPAPEPVQPAPGAKPTGPAPRPLAGPVVPLTGTTVRGDELLGSARTRASPPDPVATKVLTKGEPVAAPSGRADDFTWPQAAVPDNDPPPVPATAVAPQKPAPPARQRPRAQR